jgi:hypothetical protein
MESIDERAAACGLSLAKLARASRVSYHRIWSAARLTPDELFRIETVLQGAEKKTATGATRAAVQEAAVAAATSTEA